MGFDISRLWRDTSGARLNRLTNAEDLYGGVDKGGDLQRASFGAERFGVLGAAGYEDRGREAAAQRGQLQGLSDQYGRLASGQDSVSAEQLRQALQQNQSAQISAAAGASPANQAMAARNASLAASRLGGALAGQQATAGLQERQQAMGQQAQIQAMIQQGLLNQRAQDVQAALGGQGNAIQGRSAIEANRTNRYATAAGQPTEKEQLFGVLGSIGSMAGLSDRRAKRDIEDGDEAADELVKSLRGRGKMWKYKDKRDGAGEYLGPMAQDLERTRAGKGIVVNTPRGKMVDGAKLASALAAAMPRLDERIERLERKRR